jgi:hypothetical protein
MYLNLENEYYPKKNLLKLHDVKKLQGFSIE